MAWISGEMRSENILSESKKSIHAFSYLCDKKEIASMVKKQKKKEREMDRIYG
jgi:hypothetical protein